MGYESTIRVAKSRKLVRGFLSKISLLKEMNGLQLIFSDLSVIASSKETLLDIGHTCVVKNAEQNRAECLFWEVSTRHIVIGGKWSAICWFITMFRLMSVQKQSQAHQ